jgi:hypothetical protein
MLHTGSPLQVQTEVQWALQDALQGQHQLEQRLQHDLQAAQAQAAQQRDLVRYHSMPTLCLSGCACGDVTGNLHMNWMVCLLQRATTHACRPRCIAREIWGAGCRLCTES